MPDPNPTTLPDSHSSMAKSTPVTLPTIHLNGTCPANLEAEYRAVRQAIRSAEGLLQAATCNARDFYPQGPGAWQRAQAEREEAFRLLEQVSSYAQAWEGHAADHRRTKNHG